jgi:hypothetical protein
MHVYPERFDAQPGALFGAPQVSAERYRQVQTTLDLDRAVVVQANGYSYDNALLR